MKCLSTCSVLGVVFVMRHHITEAADTIQHNVDRDNKKVIDYEEESKDRTQTGMDHKCLMMFQVGNHLVQRKAPRFLTEVQLPFYFQRHGMYCKHYTVAACSGCLLFRFDSL